MNKTNPIEYILIILILLLLFHSLIMGGIIPYESVWGGRLKNTSEMLVFETISIALNLLMLLIVAVKAGRLKINLPQRFIKLSFWAMFILFSFNTVGNILSVNPFEKYVFSPITLILAILCLFVVLKEKNKTI